MPWHPSGGSSLGAVVSANGTTQIAASSATPATPNNGYAGLISVPGPSRAMLAQIDSLGIVSPLQTNLAISKAQIGLANGSGLTLIAAPWGQLGPAGWSGGGTPTINFQGYNSAAGAGSAAGLYTNNGPGVTASLGLYVAIEFAYNDAVATANMFAGLLATSEAIGGPTDVQPQTFTNVIGVGRTSGDANLQLYAAGTAAQARTNLGMALVQGDFYRVELASGPSSGNPSWGYQVTNLATGASIAGTVQGTAAQVPSKTATLGMFAYRSNGGTASAVALWIASAYIEQGNLT